MIRDAIKHKLSTFTLRWDTSDICTKSRTSRLNQTCQREHSFTPFVLLTMDSIAWTVSKNQTLICILYPDAFDVTLNASVVSHNQVSTVKQLDASG